MQETIQRNVNKAEKDRKRAHRKRTYVLAKMVAKIKVKFQAQNERFFSINVKQQKKGIKNKV